MTHSTSPRRTRRRILARDLARIAGGFETNPLKTELNRVRIKEARLKGYSIETR
ncbi:MAG: hypothetical protein ACYTG1_04735 [Planctomycetota bacterium]|jgi:hypothetical protein